MTRWAAVAIAAFAFGVLDPVAADAAGPPVQRISTDPYSGDGAQHATQVEPDTFAFGTTIVSVFQSGRFFTGGGASNIGFATSHDGGQTWADGFFPSLTTASTPAGPFARASDPSIAFDSTHGRWIASILACSPPTCGGAPPSMVASTSADGTNWSAPVTVAAGTVGTFYDKNWIVCDNWPTSPFVGRCYFSWDDAAAGGTILTSTSTDGGVSWSAPVAAPGGGLGVQPVVQPNGTLVVVARAGPTLRAFLSTNGGTSFTGPITFAATQYSQPTAMRAVPIPSVEIDAAGKIYVVWPDCQFRLGCPAAAAPNDLVMSTSTDGASWTTPERIPLQKIDGARDHFIPGLAVDISTSGPTAKLAIAYYYFRKDNCIFERCRLNVGFTSSTDGGRTWRKPRKLNRRPMRLSWIADTDIGRMVGDYISTSFVGTIAVPVFSLAVKPKALLDQAIFAAAVTT
jgi:BNR repeat-like domain